MFSFLFFLQMPGKCVNEEDHFCYICYKNNFCLTKAQHCGKIAAPVRKAYHLYFGCNIGDQDKS